LINQGDFDWKGEATVAPTLKNVQLYIKPGTICALSGVVGSGKTSLLSAILGEIPPLRGVVTVAGSISYVPQIAWLEDGTIRCEFVFTPTQFWFAERTSHLEETLMKDFTIKYVDFISRFCWASRSFTHVRLSAISVCFLMATWRCLAKAAWRSLEASVSDFHLHALFILIVM
jgi:energy-coupling factor transporter ATP-binding protein EcfA2